MVKEGVVKEGVVKKVALFCSAFFAISVLLTQVSIFFNGRSAGVPPAESMASGDHCVLLRPFGRRMFSSLQARAEC